MKERKAKIKFEFPKSLDNNSENTIPSLINQGTR